MPVYWDKEVPLFFERVPAVSLPMFQLMVSHPIRTNSNQESFIKEYELDSDVSFGES